MGSVPTRSIDSRPPSFACGTPTPPRSGIRGRPSVDPPPASTRQRQDRFLVAPAAEVSIGEDAVSGDPIAGLGVDLLRIRLEHEPLARSPAPRVHAGVEALGKLVFVIVRVFIRSKVDIALRAT